MEQFQHGVFSGTSVFPIEQAIQKYTKVPVFNTKEDIEEKEELDEIAIEGKLIIPNI